MNLVLALLITLTRDPQLAGMLDVRIMSGASGSRVDRSSYAASTNFVLFFFNLLRCHHSTADTSRKHSCRFAARVRELREVRRFIILGSC
jgi:hypothetical protein